MAASTTIAAPAMFVWPIAAACHPGLDTASQEIQSVIQIAAPTRTKLAARSYVLVLFCSYPAYGDVAVDTPRQTAASRVEMNANFAGCISASVVDYKIGTKQIEASLRIEKDTHQSEGPCVCRSGFYYFSVFASERILPKDRAWMYAKSFYKTDLALGVLPLKPYVMPHIEKIRFPLFKSRSGRAFAYYYLAIGCP